MPSNNSSTTASMCHAVPRNFAYEKKFKNFPVLIVDNNSGFVLITEGLVDGYKNPSLKYSGIKECMGFNFYASNESVGVFVVIDGTMYSVLDMKLDDFFTTTIPTDAEVSLVSAFRISTDKIYVAAVANVKPSIDKMVFASKIVTFSSLCLSVPLPVMHGTTTAREVAEYNTIFNNGEQISSDTSSNVQIVSYENFNASRGFSDVTVVEMESANGDDGRYIINSQIYTDVKSLDSGLFESVNAIEGLKIDAIGSYSTASVFNVGYDDVMFIITEENKTHILYAVVPEDTIFHPGVEGYTSIDGRSIWFEEYDFNDLSVLTTRRNIYFDKMMPIYNENFTEVVNYTSVYSPSGILKRFKKPKYFCINRIVEKTTEKGNAFVIASYLIPVKKSENGYYGLDFSDLLNEENKVAPSEKLIMTYDPTKKDDIDYTFYAQKRIYININSILKDSDIVAQMYGTIFQSEVAGTYNNQNKDIMAAKSMCPYLNYGQQEIN